MELLKWKAGGTVWRTRRRGGGGAGSSEPARYGMEMVERERAREGRGEEVGSTPPHSDRNGLSGGSTVYHSIKNSV